MITQLLGLVSKSHIGKWVWVKRDLKPVLYIQELGPFGYTSL